MCCHQLTFKHCQFNNLSGVLILSYLFAILRTFHLGKNTHFVSLPVMFFSSICCRSLFLNVAQLTACFISQIRAFYSEQLFVLVYVLYSGLFGIIESGASEACKK